MKNRIILQTILVIALILLIAGCERKPRLDNLTKAELIEKMQPVRDKLNKAMVENDGRGL